MPGEIEQTFELSMFVQNSFAHNLRMLKFSFERSDRFEQAYRFLAVAEMLGWAELGEMIGFFPRRTAYELWVTTDGMLAKAAGTLFSLVKNDHRLWSVFGSAEGENPFRRVRKTRLRADKDTWSWFRSQLLLAQRFAKSSPCKIVLASFVTMDENEWKSDLSKLRAMVERMEDWLEEFETALLNGGTNVDEDIFTESPRVVLIAGFFLLLGQVTLRNEQSERTIKSRVDFDVNASFVRQCRLNFRSSCVRNRFMELAKLAKQFHEMEMLSRPNSELETLSPGETALSHETSDKYWLHIMDEHFFKDFDGQIQRIMRSWNGRLSLGATRNIRARAAKKSRKMQRFR